MKTTTDHQSKMDFNGLFTEQLDDLDCCPPVPHKKSNAR